MALNKCRECGTCVSSKAKNCPACGCPKPVKAKSSGCLLFALVGFFAIVLIAVFQNPDDSGNIRNADESLRQTPKEARPGNANTILDPQSTNEGNDPVGLVDRWDNVGLKVEIPWRRSNSPGPDYSYIAQCRTTVGSVGDLGFSTEVECEVLGHDANRYYQCSVGLEVWNDQYLEQAKQIVIAAIKQIDGDPPLEVVDALTRGASLQKGSWEVADESTDRLREYRVYYRP